MSSAKDNNNEPGQHACEQGTFELPWQVELARKIRFGIVDQAILILSLIFGVSLEATVARRFKVPGYGIVVGGAIGNIVSDVVAAYGEDLRPIAAVGCGIGGILLMLPLGVSLALKKPLSDRRIQFGLAASTIGFGPLKALIALPSVGYRRALSWGVCDRTPVSTMSSHISWCCLRRCIRS